MSTQHTLTPGSKMRADLSDFISRNLDNRELGWPCVTRKPSSKANVQRNPARSCGLRVLVVGELALELPIAVRSRRAEVAAALRDDESALAPQSEMRPTYSRECPYRVAAYAHSS